MIFTAEDILTRLRTHPFTPMQLVTTTGDTFDIYHPELVVPTRRFIEVGMPTSDNPAIAEQIERVALVHIVALRDLPSPVQPIGSELGD